MRLGALLLAAGGAVRFGSPKLIAEIDGKPLIAHAIDALFPLFGKDLYCVVGANANRIRPYAEPYCRLLHNSHWQDGIGCSISCGIRHMTDRQSWDGILIALADHAGLKRDEYSKLVSAYRGDRVCAAHYCGAAGVPAIFPPEWFERLKGLKDDRGAASLIRADGVNPDTVPIPQARFDVDRPEDIVQFFSP